MDVEIPISILSVLCSIAKSYKNIVPNLIQEKEAGHHNQFLFYVLKTIIIYFNFFIEPTIEPMSSGHCNKEYPRNIPMNPPMLDPSISRPKSFWLNTS